MGDGALIVAAEGCRWGLGWSPKQAIGIFIGEAGSPSAQTALQDEVLKYPVSLGREVGCEKT